jgi:hypothetical protein
MQVTGVTSIVIMGVLPTGLLPRGLVADAGLTDGAPPSWTRSTAAVTAPDRPTPTTPTR